MKQPTGLQIVSLKVAGRGRDMQEPIMSDRKVGSYWRLNQVLHLGCYPYHPYIIYYN